MKDVRSIWWMRRVTVCLLGVLLAACANSGERGEGGVSQVAVSAQSLTLSDCPAGYNVIQGTSGNDTIDGTSGNDCIFGWGGNDTLRGLGGDDYIAGGNGDDVAYGGDGDDRVYGEAGNDRLEGNIGSDTLDGAGGSDTLYGGDGDDSIDGQANADTIYGEAGNDVIDGGGGDDTIDGGSGSDDIAGDDGIDTVHGGSDDDRIHGNGGVDYLYGDDGDDILDGDTYADTIYGGDGDDVIYGDAANDILNGDAGDDALLGGAGTNVSDGGPGTDACTGTSCEKPELTLSGCTQDAQCASDQHCIADFGLCIGCVSDQDSDGACDSKDGCSTDPDKTTPGACGCGAADTDSDADGTADCIDGCPSDPAKIAAGACGCGVSDTDGDGDGVADCHDQCPGIDDSSFDCVPNGVLVTRSIPQEVFNGGFSLQTTVSGTPAREVLHPFSADGSTIVGFQAAYNGTDDRAFRWTVDNGIEWLADLLYGADTAAALSVSADGTTAAGACRQDSGPFSYDDGCRWVGAPGSNPEPQRLQSGVPGYWPTLPYATSSNGQTIVGTGRYAALAGRTYAFRWTPTGHTDLGSLVLDGTSVATDVSADGSVVIGWTASAQRPGAWEPFRWSAATGMVGMGFLPYPGNHSGRATAVSADGQVIVGWTGYQGYPRAFRWTSASGMQPLPLRWPTSTFDSYAHAVSSDGSVVLGTDATESGYFVWSQAYGIEDVRSALTRSGINVTGWTFTGMALLDIGDTLCLTGYATYQGGAPVVWRAAFQ